jgi:5-methylcytosine-specific restriction protein A
LSVALREIGRDQVLAAIAEYDRLGQDAFLDAHGFRQAREYLFVHDGRTYDSKAIVGVAHGYLPGQPPLKASEFSGGEATVGRLLRDLGFAVQVGTGLTPDRLARLLRNLNVNRPDGIPALYQPIMLLWAFGRAVRGEPRMLGWDATQRSVQPLFGLYGRAGEDRGKVAYPASALYGAGLWELDAGGEPVPRSHGSVTERWFRERQPRGGLAGPVHELIRDSEEARVAAVGALVSAFFTGTGADHVGLLTEVGLLSAAFPVTAGPGAESVLPGSPLEQAYRELYAIASAGAGERASARADRTASLPVRSAAARRAVLVRSGGRCENPRCAGDIQDRTRAGDPILEIDHVWDLALGGPDDPAQMVALCPNCHAIKTRGRTGEQLRAELLAVARSRHEAMLQPELHADGRRERAPRFRGNAQDRSAAVLRRVADEHRAGGLAGLDACGAAVVAAAGLAPAGVHCWLCHRCSASWMSARDSSMVRAYPRIRSNNAAALPTRAWSSMVWSSTPNVTIVSVILGPLAISNCARRPGKYPVSRTTWMTRLGRRDISSRWVSCFTMKEGLLSAWLGRSGGCCWPSPSMTAPWRS